MIIHLKRRPFFGFEDEACLLLFNWGGGRKQASVAGGWGVSQRKLACDTGPEAAGIHL